MHTRPLSVMEEHGHHILVSPASASSATSLAATLTPGTPTALDEQKHTLALSSINLNLSSSSSNPVPGPPSSASESSDNGSLLSSLDDTDDDDFDNDNDDISDYGSEIRHQRAKQAARILLSQCLFEDNPRYYSEDAYSRSGRLGLAPITLLLNPETPCPTKIIPLPTINTSESNNYASSNSSLDDDDNEEDEENARAIQEAQRASLFIRLL